MEGARGGGGGGLRNPCLTMHQPWASLLVHDTKRVEGRSWPSPVTGRLWIHAASKGFGDGGASIASTAPVTLQPPPRHLPRRDSRISDLPLPQWLLLDLIPPCRLDAPSTLPPPQQGCRRTPSSPTAPAADPLLHFLLTVTRSIYDSDLTFLLCV
ncbi:hypothetical protein ACQJBY_023669 [Aegilops geniculata]